MTDKKIIVLGAGISGLATAYWLKEKGFDIKILESKPESGGAMETTSEDGFLIDFGPNSGLETTPLISKLVEAVGLKDEMIYANDSAAKRYILRGGDLHALPTSPGAFISSKLFSLKGKLRLMREPFIGRSADGYYQSMAQFVRRRLGQEFLDYAIDPFVSGVFAGDPEKLSVKSAFPKLYRLEEIYGGLVKGMIKGAKERKQRAEQSKQSAKMFSFTNGMQSFPKAITGKLNSPVEYNCKIEKVKKTQLGYQIIYSQNGDQKTEEAKLILSTIPAHISAGIFEELDGKLAEHFRNIYHPPVMVLYLGFNKSDIKRPLDGFGYLIPSKERKNFLGAIWSSTIFTNRAPENKAAFTLFVGGARSPHIFSKPVSEVIETAVAEFKEIMGITAEPVIKRERMWSHAIPQYNLGYIEHDNYFAEFEKNNPGFFLGGNYRGGISVGDCIKNSEINADKIIEYINKSK